MPFFLWAIGADEVFPDSEYNGEVSNPFNQEVRMEFLGYENVKDLLMTL